MASYNSAMDLIGAARAAKAEIDQAQSKADVAAVFSRHYRAIGYKALGRILNGTRPEGAVERWAGKLNGGQ